MAEFQEMDGKLFINGKEVLRDWESMAAWYCETVDFLFHNVPFALTQSRQAFHILMNYVILNI